MSVSSAEDPGASALTPAPIRRNAVPSISFASMSRQTAKILLASWVGANVVRGRANGTVSAMASCTLGDITADQFRALADIQRDFGLDIRITNRQNLAFRVLNEADLRGLYDRLTDIGMAEAGAELARVVVSEHPITVTLG